MQLPSAKTPPRSLNLGSLSAIALVSPRFGEGNPNLSWRQTGLSVVREQVWLRSGCKWQNRIPVPGRNCAENPSVQEM
eukprot:1682402-Rhodomonas_salina.1